MLSRLLLASSLLAFPVVAQSPAAPVHLVLVRTTGPAQLQQLLALDLDLAACRQPLLAQRRVEVLASDQDLALLRNRGFEVRVVQRDLGAWYAAQAAQHGGYPDSPNPPLGQGAMGGHWTFAQMESILDDLHTQNPQICAAKVSIGSSIEGRPLWMVKISDNVGVDENEPEVLFDALHHAREPLSMETTVVFMEWLIDNYGVDPDATLIVDERELFFVPCVNPDGYVYNQTTNPNGGGLWRKNRRNNGDGTFGVDLNRNYATMWTAPNGGSSPVTSSQTYRGTAPFSEPEVTAVENFAIGRSFVTVFSTHTYADILLRPWCWEVADPANAADYNTLGSYYTVENGMPHGRWSTLLYISGGTSVDHHHTARGSYTWTAELGRSSEGGFWPSGQNIINIAERYQPMFRKVALTAGATFRIDAVAVSEAAGGNGNGRVDPGETGEVTVTVENAGLGAVPGVVTLQAITAGVAIGTGSSSLGTVLALATTANATPLSFSTPVGFAAPVITLRAVVTGDGRATEQVFTVDLRDRRAVLTDDFESDHGFARAPGGTATTGLWERAAPQATSSGGVTIQPGNQTTPGGSLCWVTDSRAGSSAGTHDVDGGHTDLVSPVMDLSHLFVASASMQLWYGESQANDPMAVDVSRDGGVSFSPLYSRSQPTGAWTTLEVELGAPLTDQMQLRVRAQDLAPSLVECLIDDWVIRGFPPDGAITVLGSGAPASDVQVAMHAQPGEMCFPLVAFAAGVGTTYPGVSGALLLDAASVLALPFVMAGPEGRAAREVALPAGGGFAGVQLHFQAAVLGSGAAFGANTTVLVLQ